MQAVEFGNVDLIRRFCNEKFDKNQADSVGNTAVHLAVLYGFYSIAELLFKNRFPLDVANKVIQFQRLLFLLKKYTYGVFD